jgi:hypothetical protein
MTGCSFFQDREEHVVDKSDPQYLELKAMLEQQKIEWEAQKPALKRLVENEDELALLVEILSKMSVIGDAESLENFMLENQIDAKEKNKGIALKSDESSQQPNYKNRNKPFTPLADSPE